MIHVARKDFTLDPYADVNGVGGGVWVNFHCF